MRPDLRPEPVLGTESDVLGERIIAFLLDLAIVNGLFVLAVSVVGGIASAVIAFTGVAPGAVGAALVGTSDTWTLLSMAAAVLGVVATPLSLAYFVVLEWKVGRTPGKMAMGLVVVGEDGSPVGLRATVVRNLLRWVDSVPSVYLVGLGSMLATDRRQRLGDLAADTVVVRAELPRRDPSGDAAPVAPSPG